jgi:phage terminase large subunit-like protein
MSGSATSRPSRANDLRELIADPTTVITRGSTYDNRFNLPAAFLAQIVNLAAGRNVSRPSDLPGYRSIR